MTIGFAPDSRRPSTNDAEARSRTEKYRTRPAVLLNFILTVLGVPGLPIVSILLSPCRIHPSGHEPQEVRDSRRRVGGDIYYLLPCEGVPRDTEARVNRHAPYERSCAR